MTRLRPRIWISAVVAVVVAVPLSASAAVVPNHSDRPHTVIYNSIYDTGYGAFDWASANFTSEFVVPQVSCDQSPSGTDKIDIDFQWDDEGSYLGGLRVAMNCRGTTPTYNAFFLHNTSVGQRHPVAAGDVIDFDGEPRGNHEYYRVVDASADGTSSTWTLKGPPSHCDGFDAVVEIDDPVFPPFAPTVFHHVSYGGLLSQNPDGYGEDGYDPNGRLIATVSPLTADGSPSDGESFTVTDAVDPPSA